MSPSGPIWTHDSSHGVPVPPATVTDFIMAAHSIVLFLLMGSEGMEAQPHALTGSCGRSTCGSPESFSPSQPTMTCFGNFTNQLQRVRNLLWKQTEEPCGGGQPTQGSAGIPVVRKVCYAVGGVPCQMAAAAIGISLQIFLLDVVKMEAMYVSMILFASRAWDAVTDPLVGYLASRSNWTPIGKLTPWLVISTPFAVLSYAMLWFVPTDSMSEAGCVLWFLMAACLFETLMSCYNVPYLSLNMFLGGHQRDRDSATAYRMTVEMLAMLLASVIQGQVVSVYGREKQEACEQLDQAASAPPGTSSPQTVSLQETQKAFLSSALAMGSLFFLCSLVLFFGVREQKAPVCSDDKRQPSYLSSLKMLICHIPYQRLVLGFVFSVLGFQMSLGNFALFCSEAAGLGSQFQLLLLVLLVSASLAVPLWQMVLLRIGKKTTLFVGLSLFIPAAIVVACFPSNLPVFMTMCVLMGFSIATMFLLPWSMLPDVVDDFALKHPSCKDLEPLFFSGYAFCSKLAGGLSVGLSTMTLQIAGYKAGACNHGDGVAIALIVLFAPVPIVLLLIGMVFFCTYPVNERQRLQLQEQLHPEVPPTSSPVPEECLEPAMLQESTVAVVSASDSNPKTSSLNKSHSFPRSYRHHKNGSLKYSIRSNGSLKYSIRSNGSLKDSIRSTVSHIPFGENCTSSPHVVSERNPKPQRQSLKGPSAEGAPGVHLSGNQADSCKRSQVRSRVSWV
ncbi:sodium-dependent lysophosphatidylcholine symporter 1-B-like isoform 1-T2 [Menidia menidia]